MSNISDQSGDEREQRIAELKRKMQEAAAKNKAAQETTDDANDGDAVESVLAATAEDAQPEQVEPENIEVQSSEVETVSEPAEPIASVEADEGHEEMASVQENRETEAVLASAAIPLPEEKSEEEKLRSQMNRREFLTYTWGAAMGLLLLGSGVATFQFMYPRFKAGEFGGAFLMGPETALPPTDASPQPVTDGKFWWINTEEEGPQALYMVCTHLGCLYKWVEERYRFECPCHGSKFTREGLYIEGPAPRSLDHFVTELIDGVWVVDTGAKVNGGPAALSPAAGTG